LRITAEPPVCGPSAANGAGRRRPEAEDRGGQRERRRLRHGAAPICRPGRKGGPVLRFPDGVYINDAAAPRIWRPSPIS
jgi:hypothetical protein